MHSLGGQGGWLLDPQIFIVVCVPIGEIHPSIHADDLCHQDVNIFLLGTAVQGLVHVSSYYCPIL